MSFSAFARRRGVTTSSVSVAVRKGRLSKCLAKDSSGRLWIADVALADEEWVKNRGAFTSSPAVERELAAKDAAAARKSVLPGAAAPPTPPPARPPPDGGSRRDPDDIPEVHDGMTLNEASAIEKRWRAKLVQLEFRKKAGELIEASIVQQGLVDVFSACRAKLLGVSVRAKQRLPHLSAKDVALIDELVREALEELSRYGEEHADDEDTE